MEQLVGPTDNYKSAQKKVQRYLKSLSDKELKIIYENLEFTPFAKLLKVEYEKRFRKTF